MWFGTIKGLNKYDGSSFSNYYSLPDDSLSLNSDFIINLFSDSKSRLWVCTDRGLSLFNYRTDHFQNLLPHLAVYNIKEDATGLLWLATSNGIMSFNPETKQVTKESDYFGDLQGKSAVDMHFIDSVQLLVVFRTEGIYLFNTQSKAVFPFGEAHQIVQNLKTETNKLSLISDDQLLLSIRGNHPLIIDIKSQQAKAWNSPKLKNIENVVSYKSKLYISTLNEGILCFDTKSDEFSSIKHDQLQPESLAGNQTRTVYIDNQE